ncbi:ferritin-like domain-containing protein [Bibersteinia trehalosi]|uniref:Bacterioferritin n=2 Tax=Bibersteinia trehalosi TaxID=47735 RepID=A0A179CVI5_BIBTR|nr:ferritin-like domain-containing protein [Bibersteinia trehalosi]AGH37357.1 bacterioferritin, an iron storage homoprotein [Bibersteinia trehalosi USDA-ARS-USMARC-192]AHG85169.1 bacterioferritin, an iron storage homoprotein [Bibersteinia trehalosi USDA-ARS-USMARC-189]OAQ13913.1 bacterioferritin [Bibersteinia trehalosi Y31]
MNSKIIEKLNELLAVYQMANIQHQTHLALVRAWGYEKLAETMAAHIDDEPETIINLQNRILDLGGEIAYTLPQPTFGTDIASAFEADLKLQIDARPRLNEVIELFQAEHDATSRVLVEGILKDEEEHLAWLEAEMSLLERLGDQLYLAARA